MVWDLEPFKKKLSLKISSNSDVKSLSEHGSQTVASATPGKLLEMQIAKLHPRLNELESLRWSPGIGCFTNTSSNGTHTDV
jgi:hypothetical protein